MYVQVGWHLQTAINANTKMTVASRAVVMIEVRMMGMSSPHQCLMKLIYMHYNFIMQVIKV